MQIELFLIYLDLKNQKENLLLKKIDFLDQLIMIQKYHMLMEKFQLEIVKEI